jgi:hypothetical protein
VYVIFFATAFSRTFIILILNVNLKTIKGNVKKKSHYQEVSDVLCKYSSLLFALYYLITAARNGVSYIDCKSICTRTVVLSVDCMAI